jgi:hypothetical protein
MKEIYKIENVPGLNYVDFYEVGKENPHRVSGCSEYSERIKIFLSELFKEIEEKINKV